jgi:hypothetical protein
MRRSHDQLRGFFMEDASKRPAHNDSTHTAFHYLTLTSFVEHLRKITIWQTVAYSALQRSNHDANQPL